MSGQKRYSLRRSLRDTLYGKVFLGLDNHTNQPIIIKQCSLWHVKNFTSVTGTQVREDAFEEIRLHQELSADEDLPVFVLKLLDVVQDDENLFIILEFARGGEMFSYVQGRGRPDPNVEAERVARLRQQHELDLIRAKHQIRQQADAAAASSTSSATTSASMNDDGDEVKGFGASSVASASSPSASTMHGVTSSPHHAASSSSASATAAARHLLSPTPASAGSGGRTPAATDEDETKGGEVGTPSVEVPRAPDLRHPFEIEACRFMRQLVEGVRYIHSKFICHRDLSLENLLLDHNRNVKIIDFGVACGGSDSPYANGDWTTHAGRIGKVGYMAPEVWDGQTYDGRLADVWSMGVIFFIMLVGCPPYEVCRPDDPRFRLIIGGRVDDLLRHWGLLHVFSPEAIDLLQRMFRPESERITIDEMIAHRFFANQSAEPLGGSSSSSSSSGASGGGGSSSARKP